MKKLLLIIMFFFVLASTAQSIEKTHNQSDRSGVTIFKRGAELRPPDTIKIDKVVVIQETRYSLIVDVFYTYQDEVPPEEVKLVVLPDMPYWASNSIQIKKCRNVGRVSIDLYEKRMKDDQVEQYETSKLTISFDYNAPDKFNGSIYKQIIPFKKLWKGRG